jgi:Family of unknown function (DUF6519)
MRGDFSRSTYRPTNHYSSVRLQQGRVLLDAEWNEQADLANHLDRTTTTDVVGRTGAPKPVDPAVQNFLVSVEQNGGDLRIAPGRIYVDGILCENDDPAGVLYTRQPDVPDAAVPADDGSYAVYLDVWERHVTGVDQHGTAFPPLLEPALQGPDTATRTRVVWQVRLSPVQTLSCADFAAPSASTGRLRAQEAKAAGPLSDCDVPAGGGYRRLENQLYRVEVHDASQANPVMKWSRDNGSIASKVESVDAAALTIVVEDAGRDDVLGFAAAPWVELSDEERELRGEAGSLLEVATVTGTSVQVKNPDGLSLTVGTNPTLRRWDGVSPLTANSPTELEDGVLVEVDAGTFHVGDYWVIPARTATGLVEWPRDGATPPAPVFEARHGTAHHYCVLAVVGLSGGTFGPPTDCRPLFPPLTAVTASDVGYDPANCGNLTGTTTVQEAIDALCKTGPSAEEKGIVVEKVLLLDGSDLVNDSVVRPEQLAGGIQVICSHELFQDSVRNTHGPENPVCLVTLDLPWPTNSVDRETWGTANFGIVGFVTLTLAAQVNADNNSIFWTPVSKPPSNVKDWLADTVMKIVEGQTHGEITRLLCRFTLKGNYIWGPKEPELYLDGELFGVPGGDHVDARLPSGNGSRGGDLEMWFWLGPE